MTVAMRLAFGLALAFAATAARADFVADVKTAREARARGDTAAAEKALAQALVDRPAHPTALYELALAQAQGGKVEPALDTLERLADQGLSYDIADDAGFAAIRGQGRFKRLQREFKENRRKRGRAEEHFTLLDPHYIPEGLAHDPDEGVYYIGSVRHRRIDRVRRGGKATEFVGAVSGRLWAPMGMTVDARRDLLWVATAAVPEMEGASDADLGRSAIVGFDLDTGKPKRYFPLKEPGPHVLGDVIVKRDGTLFTSDSRGGLVYAVDTAKGSFEALTKPGDLGSPQGLALTEDQRHLYIADYTRGLFRLKLRDRTLERVEAADDVCLYGIDGLYRHEDQLVAVQNGIRPHRVVRLELSNSGRRVRAARVLAQNLPDFDEPSLGVVVGRRFMFVANSQWGRFDDKHRLPPKDTMRRPVVLKVDIVEEDTDPAASQGTPQPAPDQGIVPQLPILR